jgi:hypothetical protein
VGRIEQDLGGKWHGVGCVGVFWSLAAAGIPAHLHVHQPSCTAVRQVEGWRSDGMGAGFCRGGVVRGGKGCRVLLCDMSMGRKWRGRCGMVTAC